MLKRSRVPLLESGTRLRSSMRPIDRNAIGFGVSEDLTVRRAVAVGFWHSAICAALAFAIGFGATAIYAARAPSCRAIATTYSGESYVIGEGTTSDDALRDAILPRDWKEIHWQGCVR